VLEAADLTADAQFTLLAGREPSDSLLGFLRLINLSGAAGALPQAARRVWRRACQHAQHALVQ